MMTDGLLKDKSDELVVDKVCNKTANPVHFEKGRL